MATWPPSPCPSPSHLAITRLALPALILNLATPLGTLISSVLFGQIIGHTSLAIFAAVSSMCSFAAFPTKYFSVGVASKVAALTSLPTSSTGSNKKNSFEMITTISAIFAGALPAAILAAAASQLVAILKTPQQETLAYYYPRVASIPFRVVAMSAQAAMSADGQMYAAAALSLVQVVIEASLTYTSLTKPPPFLPSGMRGAGTATAISWAVLAVIATAMRAWRSWRRKKKEEEEEEQIQAGAPLDESLLHSYDTNEDDDNVNIKNMFYTFLADGVRHFVRSLALQASFLAATLVVASVDSTALAAHQIILTLWLVTSYAVDGVADAVTILGSKLSSARDNEEQEDERRHEYTIKIRHLLGRASVHAVAISSSIALAFAFAPHSTVRLFLRQADHDKVMSDLFGRGSRVSPWAVLIAAQPINAFAFLADGALAASQSFGIARNIMCWGLLVFAVVLGTYLAAQKYHPSETHEYLTTLAAVWTAKTLMNVVRSSSGMAHSLLFWAPTPSS